jgi:hypothetical protein
MKVPVIKELFYNKYKSIVSSVPDECFLDDSMCSSMLEKYGGAKKPNTGQSLLRKYRSNVGEIHTFALHFPGIKSNAAMADEGTRGC